MRVSAIPCSTLPLVLVFTAYHCNAFQTVPPRIFRRGVQVRRAHSAQASLIRANVPHVSMGMAGFLQPVPERNSSVRDTISLAVKKYRSMLGIIRQKLAVRFGLVALKSLLLAFFITLSGSSLACASSSLRDDPSKVRTRVFVRTNTLQYRIYQEHVAGTNVGTNVVERPFKVAETNLGEPPVTFEEEDVAISEAKSDKAKNGLIKILNRIPKAPAILIATCGVCITLRNYGIFADSKVKEQDLDLYGEFISPDTVEKDVVPDDDEDGDEDKRS